MAEAPTNDEHGLNHRRSALDWRLTMTRYERMQFFEALCVLREAYATRSDADRRAEISVADAIAYAEAVMFAVDAEAEEALAIDEPQAQPESTPIGDPRD
jgi:hypothetical protein